jgi:hypothetical protein
MPAAGYNGGYVWNVNVWKVAFTSAQVAAYAAALAIPNPYPSPTPTSTPSSYPILSANFVQTNNPLVTKFDTLKAMSGQVTQPSNPTTLVNNIFAQGFASNVPLTNIPFYVGNSSYPTYYITCPVYNSCGATGSIVHLPSGWTPQEGTDKHVTIVDLADGLETDMWGGYNGGNPPNNCDTTTGQGGATYTLACSSGGQFKFSSKGLSAVQSANSGTSCTGCAGIAVGQAEGLLFITAGDLLSSSPISHVLGLNPACLDNDTTTGTSGLGGNVYPSSRTGGSDLTCTTYNSAFYPSPPYGAIMHLKDSVNVASLGYGKYCTKIVQAMQDYGLEMMDTGAGTNYVRIESPQVYSTAPYTTNPWYTIIEPQMIADGDGSGSPGLNTFTWNNCSAHLTASMFEIYYDPNLGY